MINWFDLILCGLLLGISLLFFWRRAFYIALIAMIYGVSIGIRDFIKSSNIQIDLVVYGLAGVAVALTVSFLIDKILYRYATTDSAKLAQKRIMAKLPILGGFIGYLIGSRAADLPLGTNLIATVITINFIILLPLMFLQSSRFLLKKELWQLFFIFCSYFVLIATKSYLFFVVPLVWHFVILYRIEKFSPRSSKVREE